MTIDPDSAKRLQKQLQKIGNANYLDALLKGVEEAILPTMRALTPVDEGDLLASEEARIEDDNVILYAGTDHAVPVEFGTVNMVAQPFMRPAIDTRKDEAMRITAKEVEEIMKREIR
jgi:HK97 gp10 family phage protein